MEIEILDKAFGLELHGFSGTAINRDFGNTGFRLMGRMWEIVKSNKLANKGINVWVYEPGDVVFAGVELDKPAEPRLGLERKLVALSKYAYYKHVGPYSQLKDVYSGLREELRNRGIKSGYPGLEIYGHYDPDESKLVTEILMAIET